MSTFLQIFLLVNVFLMGALAAVAIRHAYAHFRPETHDLHKAHPNPNSVRLPGELRAQIIANAQADFQKILSKTSEELQHDLTTTGSELNKQLEKIGNDVIANEMKHYSSELEELRNKAEDAIGVAQTDIVTQQAKLRANLEADIAAEKELLLKQIDTKLSDAVASFLTETLQHNVDLGAQTEYLMSILEEHKAEFANGVKDEA